MISRNRPRRTVIAQDTAAIGRVAAGRLFARIDGDHSARQIIRTPFELVARGSGELPRHYRLIAHRYWRFENGTKIARIAADHSTV